MVPKSYNVDLVHCFLLKMIGSHLRMRVRVGKLAYQIGFWSLLKFLSEFVQSEIPTKKSFITLSPGPSFTRNSEHADANDDEEVEGRRADDGSRPEAVGLEPLADDLNHGKEDLWNNQLCLDLQWPSS